MSAIAPPPGKIFAAIPAIISEVGPVGKNSKNQQQGYNYRSADDISDALHDALGRHGVFCTCAISKREVSERPSKNGGVLFYVTLKATYTFYASDGSFVCTQSCGEAMDSGDKATNKAMTAAYKYALIQVFAMMGHEDSETETPEPAYQEQDHRPRYSKPACPSCGKTESVMKDTKNGGFACWKSKGGCEARFDETGTLTSEAKSNGKRKESEPQEDPFTSNEGAFFDSLRDEIGQISSGRAFNAFRAKAAQAFGEKKITAKQLGSLIGSLVHKASSVSGLNELGKWIADVRIEMNADDSKCFDEAEELIREKLEGLAAGAT